MSNLPSSWIDEVFKQCEDAETPRDWIYWACMSAIGGVTSCNVYFERHYYQLQPNLFIMLVGESGLGKGFPTTLARKLVESVGNQRVISGRNSIQSIISECAKVRSVEGGGVGIKDARSYLTTGEFVNFVIDDPHSLSVFTEWYDTHWMGEWKNTLKHSGVEKLKGICCNLFVGSSPAHLKNKIGPADVEGGFLGRTLISFEDKRYKDNDLTEAPEDKLDIVKLSEYLKAISKLKGQFQFTAGGKLYFQRWFEILRKKIQPNVEDKTGILHRMQDHVLKVAMCIALSKVSIFHTGLFINEADIEEAVNRCRKVISGANRALLGKVAPNIAQASPLMINEMLKNPKFETTREHLLGKFWGEFNSTDLDMAEITLEQGGIITVANTKDNRYYTLTDKFMAQYNNSSKKAKDKKETLVTHKSVDKDKE